MMVYAGALSSHTNGAELWSWTSCAAMSDVRCYMLTRQVQVGPKRMSLFPRASVPSLCASFKMVKQGEMYVTVVE